jgi:hypothetical protein
MDWLEEKIRKGEVRVSSAKMSVDLESHGFDSMVEMVKLMTRHSEQLHVTKVSVEQGLNGIVSCQAKVSIEASGHALVSLNRDMSALVGYINAIS